MSLDSDNRKAARELVLRSEVVEAEIERQITSGILREGSHIVEQTLADKLSVNRGTIREACRALQRAGIIDIIPNRGAFVRYFNLDEIVEVFEIRATLSFMAALAAADRISRGVVDELHTTIDAMDDASAANDAAVYLKLNLQFHNRIFEVAGNKRLLRLENDLSKELRMFRHQALVAGGHLAERNSEHREILRCLAIGEGERAAELSRKHVLRGLERFMAATKSKLAAGSDYKSIN